MTKADNRKQVLKETIRFTGRAMKLEWKEYPSVYLSVAVYSLLNAVLPYVGIWFSARIVDELAGKRDPETLIRYIAVLLIATALVSFLKAAAERWKTAVLAGSYFKETQIYTKKFLCMDFLEADSGKTKERRSNIEQSRNWAGWGISRVRYDLEEGATACFKIAGAAVLTVSLFTSKVSDGELGFINEPICSVLLLIVMLSVIVLSAYMANRSEKYWSDNSVEGLRGNRCFNSFGMLGMDKKRAMDIRIYRQEMLALTYLRKERAFVTGGRLAGYAKGVMGFLQAGSAAVSYVFTGMVYGFVCLKAYGGAFGVGSVTQYIGAITALAGGISTLLLVWGRCQANVPFLRTAFEYLDTPNEMYQGSLTIEKRSDRKYDIEFRDVSFRYPGTKAWALRHVSLTFRVGERMAVVGENGSGKTTFIKLLCRLYDPTEGEILLNGINIRKYSYLEYLSVFSVVFQDFRLLAFSLGENVAAAKEYDRKRAEKCLREAGFGARLAKLEKGLDTCLYKDFDDAGVEISGGEAQKTAIARALYKDAPFIILDEPTAALDPVAEAEVYSRFNDLVGDKTAIYISHRLSSCRFCDEIMVFDRGKVVQKGRHEELVSEEQGKYYQLWMAQAQYYQ